jgi:leucyl aminopeptidase
VTVWDDKKLASEKMGLHLSVGMGATHGPRMVHMKYRPTKKSGLKPIAFVGKGITFDTGGLDIKPSSAMRLMKKDMGGAASVIALALWASESQYPGPLDFYLALAENAVDANAFRPGDIVTARNGMKVEIDNTDAEGRLVLADVLDVACKQKGSDDPEFVIDVATLTGAIKVGLGAEIAGLFANDDDLAIELTKAGQRAGDLNWRMPLFDKYWGDLSSPFADCKNSGGGFGGAITAALFLQKFVGGKKWAHLDVYAWADRPSGAIGGSGGSGQPVQCLIEFLESRV